MNADFGCGCCTCRVAPYADWDDYGWDEACRSHGAHGVRACVVHGMPGENCIHEGCKPIYAESAEEIVPFIAAKYARGNESYIHSVMILFYFAVDQPHDTLEEVYWRVASSLGRMKDMLSPPTNSIGAIVHTWLEQKVALGSVPVSVG